MKSFIKKIMLQIKRLKPKRIPNSTVAVVSLSALAIMISVLLARGPLFGGRVLGEQINSSAIVQNETGIVEVKEINRPWTSVSTETRIEDTSFIKTSENSKASVILPGNSVMRLRENSEVSIERMSYNKKQESVQIIIRELRGNIWIFAPGVYQKNLAIRVDTFHTQIQVSQATFNLGTKDNESEIRVIDGSVELSMIERNDSKIETIKTARIKKDQESMITNENLTHKQDITIKELASGFHDENWYKFNMLKDSIALDLLNIKDKAKIDPYILDTNKSSITTRDIFGNEDDFDEMNEKKLEAYLRTSKANQQNLKLENDEDMQKLLDMIGEVKTKFLEKDDNVKKFWKKAMVGISTLKAKEKFELDLMRRVIEELTINFKPESYQG